MPPPVPYAIAEKAIEVGKLRIATHEVPKAFAIRLAGPFPGPRFTPGVVAVEPDTPQRLPTAMRTAFHVAPVLVLSA